MFSLKRNLHEFENETVQLIAKGVEEKIIPRIFERDHTVWSNDETEITNRLGWLESVNTTKNALSEIIKFVEEIRGEGFTHALLLGMGGSSLAPEVFRLSFGVKEGYLDLSVLDSTDPAPVLKYTDSLDPQKTLYIVSTKSGGTVETLSFMKYFYTHVKSNLGDDVANHFMAITDPGSGLENMAHELNFRKIFLNDPNIGGRYSALSFFGMVPAALLGVDMEKFLANAEDVMNNNKLNSAGNTGLELGALLGALADNGRDKVTMIMSKEICSFGGWVEQLVAESTGKIGKGILPVDMEELCEPEIYSCDRLFVHIKLKNDNTVSPKVDALEKSGYPVVRIELDEIYDLAGQFFLWEMATIVSSWKLQIQPFDQPNVESAKVVAREMVAEFSEKGVLPELDLTLEENGIKVYSSSDFEDLETAVTEFLNQYSECKGEKCQGRSYVSIQAYINPGENEWNALQQLRSKILRKYKLATTIGFGPRFLHSTGQLHKGDAGNGLFIQITSDMPNDAAIPDKAGEDNSSISFAVLKNAQALGDRKALIDNNRKVIRFNIGTDLVDGINKLTAALG